jgi:hypothetical protein
MFPVLSTSVETAQIERVVRVLQRAKIRHSINYASVYACRKIAGSDSWSQHSWGNAVDLFPRGDIDSHDAVRRAIANFVVKNTTQRTTANLGRKLAVSEVIDHSGRRIWTPERGWHEYTGTTGDHVHVSGDPLRSGTPPCA